MDKISSPAKKSKPRAVILLIEQGQIAMIERRRSGRLFYVFPGGGVEKGETLEAAAVREAKEELGLDIIVRRLVAGSSYIGRLHYYYLVERSGGEFGSGYGKELSRPADSERGSVTPLWLRLVDLMSLPVLPKRMAEYISEYAGVGFPDEVFWFDEQEE